MGFRVLILIVFASTLVALGNSQQRVAIPTGELEGTTLPVEGYDDSLIFYGVPYAEAPVGDRRFRSPLPTIPWSGVRDASKPGPICTQVETDTPALRYMGVPAYNKWEISEDCLTLDVYTRSLTGKRPVMVFMHGGGLHSGTSSVMYGFSAYSSVKDIVMVSIQYRLGALGWASMVDEHMPANLGFQDQIQALKWVQENIEHFGGDPDQVTIFGQSAGGWSVSMHILSPMSKGLFKRAILQSGAFLQTWISPTFHNNTVTAINFAKCVGCPTEDSSIMVECLRKLPAESFVATKSKPCTLPLHYFAVDGTYIPDDPEKLLESGRYNKDIEVMLGAVENEGYFIALHWNPTIMAADTSLERVRQYFLWDMSIRFSHLPLYIREAQVQEAINTYVRDLSTQGLIEAATKFLGDSLLTWPTYAFALGLSETLEGSTYLYEIRHRPSISTRPDFVGTDHCDDLILMLGSQYTGSLGLLPITLSEDDKTVADAMFNAWSNFAIYGNPNSAGAPQWPQFDSVLGQYMVFDVESHSEVNFQSVRMNFWRKTLPQLARTGVSDVIQGPIVETRSGRVHGKIVPFDDASQYAYAFMAIPFAAPPIGDLRFKSPQPARPWKGIRDASKPGFVCPQDIPTMQLIGSLMNLPFPMNIEISEDCLTLDVYTSSLTGKRPVMLFIHGGGFTSGWSSMYDMRVHAAKYNMVGVAIQYRIGPLGFLSTGDDFVKGNMGFKDQILALKWVQENIANFGGDPDQVTIFGESAGSWSVSMHIVSPLSEGLFKRAILMSGSSVGMPQIIPTAQSVELTTKLATALGCPNITTEEMTSCLINQPALKLVEASTVAMIPFNGVVDHECFTDFLVDMVEKGDFQKEVDIMAGITYVEGFIMSQMFFPTLDWTNLNVTVFRECANTAFTMFLSEVNINPAVVDEAIRVYVGDDESSEHMVYALTKFMGDIIITHATYNTAKKVIEYGNQKVYFYDFHGRPFYSNKPDSIPTDHGDDIVFAFGFSKLMKSYGVDIPADKIDNAIQIEDLMLQYFTAFAENGVPTGDGLPEWPELREDGSYMEIHANPQVKHHYQTEQMKFWLETLPTFQVAENHDEL